MVLITRITAPEEGLIYTSNNIELKIGEKIIGKGILYISQNALAWQPNDIVEGLSVLWKQISIHGISANPHKCIYFMLDHKLVWPGVYEESLNGRHGGEDHNGDGVAAAPEGAGAVVRMLQQQAAGNGVNDDLDEGTATDEESEVEEEEMQITECWLLPDDVNTVDTMFQAMTECQALHPDSADSISDESDFMDDGEDIGYNLEGDQFGPGGNGGADAAQGGMQNLNINDDRFEDADE